jgi:hypothetical protein
VNRQPSTVNASFWEVWSRTRRRLAHAFALQGRKDGARTDDLALLDRLASLLADRGLATPAIFLVQSLAPLGFLGSQLVHALSPILGMVATPDEIERLARLMEGRETPALFTDRLIHEEEARSR